MHDMYTAWLMLKTIIMIIILKVAGYVTEYDVNDFTFLTVKGAGHMVWFVLLATSFIIYYYIILCMHADRSLMILTYFVSSYSIDPMTTSASPDKSGIGIEESWDSR